MEISVHKKEKRDNNKALAFFQHVFSVENFNKLKNWAWVLFRTILLIGLSFVILYPILLKLSISIRHKDDLYDPTVVFIPKTFTLENFQYVWETMNYPRILLNTVLLAGITMLITTFICAITGYGFARFNFKGKNLLFACVIFTLLVPPQTIMVPTYLNYRDFDLFGIIRLFNNGQGINSIGSFWPFIISCLTGMGIKSGLFIFIFRQFFKQFPKEIEEAAEVDGAGPFKTFFIVMLPNAVPAIITVMLFAFVWQYNDTYFTTMFLETASVMSTQLQTVSATIYHKLNTTLGAGGVGAVDPFYLSMLLNTSVMLAILPLIIMYLFVQRYFVESVERTGIVG